MWIRCGIRDELGLWDCMAWRLDGMLTEGGIIGALLCGK